MTNTLNDLKEKCENLSKNLKNLPKDCDQKSKAAVDRETSEVLLLILDFALDMAESTDDLRDWFDNNSAEVFRLHDDHKATLREKYRERQEKLRKAR